MKKNNTAEKTIRDAEKITKALKESTEKSLRELMNEAISNIVMESEEDDEDEVEDDSYDVEDVNTEEIPEVAADNDAEAGEVNADAEDGEEDPEEDGADDEWADEEKYKVGDNDYDFTSADGDEVIKVFNKLGDDDQIFVKKEDDGTYSVKDDETGAEFVIELNPEAIDGEAGDNIDEIPDEFDGDGDELEIDLDGEGDDESEEFGNDDDEIEIPDDDEVEIDINDDEEGDELNEENLGYTDSYQKDVFAKKFNMNEPADSKSTYSMDAGAPKGSEKPWAGKGDMKPFEKNVNECGDAEVVNPNLDANIEEGGHGFNTQKSMKKHMNQIHKDTYNQRVKSENGEYKGLDESVAKIIAAAKRIQAENKQYKECVDKIKRSLYEAIVINNSEAQIINLLVNESLTRDEKKNICERFNNVKTVKEGVALRETIKRELNETRKSSPIVEKQFVAESRNLNETTIYQNANDPSLDLMKRMDNLFKK